MPKTQRGPCDFTQHRDRVLLSLFKDMISRQRGRFCMSDIAERLAECPSPRFWISEERAFRIVRRCLQSGVPPKVRANTAAMYAEIVRRVRQLLATQPDRDVRATVYEVVNSPAPSFYVTPAYARTLMYQILRK